MLINREKAIAAVEAKDLYGVSEWDDGFSRGINAALDALRALPVSDGWEDIARDALESVLEDYENMLKWPLPSPRDYEKVVSLGEEIGYGSLMVMASQAWREVLGVHAGGEFVAGPCRATAEKALAKIRAALGPLPAPPTIE